MMPSQVAVGELNSTRGNRSIAWFQCDKMGKPLRLRNASQPCRKSEKWPMTLPVRTKRFN